MATPKHAANGTSTQAADYQPKHESTGSSANNAPRILGRLVTQRAAGR